MAHRYISEHHTVKLLLEPEGAVVAFTMKTYSYLLIVSSRFVGFKKIRTQDRVVARAHYNTRCVLDLLRRLYPDGA